MVIWLERLPKRLPKARPTAVIRTRGTARSRISEFLSLSVCNRSFLAMYQIVRMDVFLLFLIAKMPDCWCQTRFFRTLQSLVAGRRLQVAGGGCLRLATCDLRRTCKAAIS